MSRPPFRDDHWERSFQDIIRDAVRGSAALPTDREVDLYAAMEAAMKMVPHRDYTSLTPIHSIRVTEHPITNGWTRLYRTDGSVVVYINRDMWEMLPMQRWAGVPLMEVPDTLVGGWRLSGTLVYYEWEQ